MMLRFTGSQETNTENFGQLKFFSSNTHTIYSPKLEVKWEDCRYDSVDDLLALTMSGEVENHFYQKHIRPEYRETEIAKFRFGARKKYVSKTKKKSSSRKQNSIKF